MTEPRSTSPRVSPEKIADLVAVVDSMPEVRPGFWALERQLALDLRDCRAALAEAEKERERLREELDAAIQERDEWRRRFEE
jgi:hypothetical protein